MGWFMPTAMRDSCGRSIWGGWWGGCRGDRHRGSGFVWLPEVVRGARPAGGPLKSADPKGDSSPALRVAPYPSGGEITAEAERLIRQSAASLTRFGKWLRIQALQGEGVTDRILAKWRGRAIGDIHSAMERWGRINVEYAVGPLVARQTLRQVGGEMTI